MGPNWISIVVIIVLVVVLFGGRGKISSIMGDFAKGIRSFRDGLKDGDEDKDAPKPLTVDGSAAETDAKSKTAAGEG